jgi:hypothetical protein
MVFSTGTEHPPVVTTRPRSRNPFPRLTRRENVARPTIGTGGRRDCRRQSRTTDTLCYDRNFLPEQIVMPSDGKFGDQQSLTSPLNLFSPRKRSDRSDDSEGSLQKPVALHSRFSSVVSFFPKEKKVPGAVIILHLNLETRHQVEGCRVSNKRSRISS